MPNEETKQELVEFEETGGYIPPTDGSEPVVSELPGTIETGTNVSAEAATTTTGQMVGNLASVPGFMLPVTQVKVGYVLYWPEQSKDLYGTEIITNVRNVFSTYANARNPQRAAGTYYYITSELTIASANDNLQNDTPDGNKAWARRTVGNYFTALGKDAYAAGVITDVRNALQNHSITNL
jgi:hypothetical protein